MKCIKSNFIPWEQFTILLAQSKLHSEPVDGGQLLNLLVSSSQTGQTYLLTKLGKPRVGKQRSVTNQLMQHIAR